ncbi:MAG: hypothetical protein EXR69_02945 [Myxococcales bacterium]|nr:hypothetical protein [Myxococcales bacterium]
MTHFGARHFLTLPTDTDPIVYNDAPAPPPGPNDRPLPGEPPEAALTTRTASSPHPRAPSSRSYDVIVRRNIFDSSAVYNPDVAVPGGGDCRDSSVKLIATVVADLPEYSSALISISGGKASRAQGFVVGDEISGEGRITSIDQKKVCTDGGGCLCMGTNGAPGKPESSTATGDPANADSGITKVSDTKYLVDQSVIENAMGNLEMLAAQVHASPHKGTDGQVDGYRLSAIRKGTLLDKLGIKNGDVVKAANGKPLNSTEGALSAFQSLSSEKSFSFDITRRSQDTTIEYEIR